MSLYGLVNKRLVQFRQAFLLTIINIATFIYVVATRGLPFSFGVIDMEVFLAKRHNSWFSFVK